MSNTREIRRRIKSIKSTSQITKAMEMVAASKMRKAQQQSLEGHSYTSLLDRMVAVLHEVKSVSEITHPLLEEKKEKKRRCILVVSTDKGLCGAVNSNLFRMLLEKHEPSNVYVALGKKARQFLFRTKKNLIADLEIKESFNFKDSKEVSQALLDLFLKEEVDTIEVLYSRFVNTLSQVPTLKRLIPICPQSLLGGKESSSQEGEQEGFIFEPNATSLLEKLLPFYAHAMIFQMILDARASEHSARMVAMKNASDNAKQIIKDLTLEYNKVRQAAITTELLEISTAQMTLS